MNLKPITRVPARPGTNLAAIFVPPIHYGVAQGITPKNIGMLHARVKDGVALALYESNAQSGNPRVVLGHIDNRGPYACVNEMLRAINRRPGNLNAYLVTGNYTPNGAFDVVASMLSDKNVYFTADPQQGQIADLVVDVTGGLALDPSCLAALPYYAPDRRTLQECEGFAQSRRDLYSIKRAFNLAPQMPRDDRDRDDMPRGRTVNSDILSSYAKTNFTAVANGLTPK